MYLIVFGISLGTWLLFEIWVFLRDRGKEKGEAAVEARRSITALAIAIALAMNIPGVAPMFDVRRVFAVYFFFGIALVWAGMLFRFWAIRTRSRFFGTRSAIQEGHDPVTTGPYRSLRNPSHTGGLVALSGLGISLGNGMSLALLHATGLVVYVWRIRREEKMLLQTLGSRYEEYRKRTWALIPFVW